MKTVLAALARHGVLLKQDARSPSVVTLLTGEPLADSWWSHPEARFIFRVLGALGDHPDVLLVKLLCGKDTLVHRPLWPALLAVAGACDPWQMQGLSRPAQQLLRRVRRAAAPVTASGPTARELLQRLLVHAVEVHTASGRHVMSLQSWSDWSALMDVAPGGPPAEARSQLEAATAALGVKLTALPWMQTSVARRGAPAAKRPPVARRTGRR